MKLSRSINLWAVVVFCACLAFVGMHVYLVSGDEPPNWRETLLLGVIQFLLTASFGFAVAKITARDNLKEAAESAFRRISDIGSSVGRLKHILEVKRGQRELDAKDIEVLFEKVLDLQTTIDSSKADWTPVLGDEIQKLDQIKELQLERDELRANVSGALNETEESLNRSEFERKVSEINKKIQALENDVPNRLRPPRQAALRFSHSRLQWEYNGWNFSGGVSSPFDFMDVTHDFENIDLSLNQDDKIVLLRSGGRVIGHLNSIAAQHGERLFHGEDAESVSSLLSDAGIPPDCASTDYRGSYGQWRSTDEGRDRENFRQQQASALSGRWKVATNCRSSTAIPPSTTPSWSARAPPAAGWPRPSAKRA